MGTRSDVAIAIKAVHVEEFEAKFQALKNDADKIIERPEGKLYYFEDIKWNRYSEIDLYNWLNRIRISDGVLIVEACHDFPESNEGDTGEWIDNPWNVGKSVSVKICFSDSSEEGE